VVWEFNIKLKVIKTNKRSKKTKRKKKFFPFFQAAKGIIKKNKIFFQFMCLKNALVRENSGRDFEFQVTQKCY
jgi:hypothetical protein